MNLNCPSSIHVDKGVVDSFKVGDEVYFTLKRVDGIVTKVGKSYLFIETDNGTINAPKNKCELV